MSSIFARFRHLLVPLILWLFSLILLSVQSYQGAKRSPSIFSRVVMELAGAPARAYSYLSSKARQLWKRYFYLVGLEEKNLLLQKKLAMLEMENQMLREQALENLRLKRLLEFKNHLDLQTIPAKIIGWDFSRFAKTLLIDKGKKDGIKKGQAVICPQGLVGQIIDEPGRSISLSQAPVLLITDPTSRVSVMVQRTRDRAIIQGTGKTDQLLLKYLPTEIKVEKGDRIITSGLSQIFPPGILVGTIEKIETNPFWVSPRGLVRPSVDFQHLEEVLVVVGENQL